MVAVCREKAEREGFSPNLYVQPMHQLDLPRRYRTIYVCGAFGLGSTRDKDLEALRRFRRHLEPGGTLLVDIEVPYADAWLWKHWLKEERESLPGLMPVATQRRPASDGAEYALTSRVLEVDPLEQRSALEMRAERWRDGELEAEETRRIDMHHYFVDELSMMIQQAGFDDLVVHGDHVARDPTPEDEFVVFVARR
jgi:ubiquinone/menaquinone biosynthesis C-methylase UbiE